MKSLSLALLAAVLAAPAFAAGEAPAVPPPSPTHERMRDFQQIALSPAVFGALAEPVESISVDDPAAHSFVVRTRNCTLAAKVVYKSMTGGTAVEVSVDVGQARCR